ncbi:MAG: hypothetical protein JOS17DRAFT_369291 [Linnemannia elongata]|nr:MAG: hypothetical protein JOS17DRAFT_369291 [Linnemannia elongata]
MEDLFSEQGPVFPFLRPSPRLTNQQQQQQQLRPCPVFPPVRRHCPNSLLFHHRHNRLDTFLLSFFLPHAYSHLSFFFHFPFSLAIFHLLLLRLLFVLLFLLYPPLLSNLLLPLLTPPPLFALPLLHLSHLTPPCLLHNPPPPLLPHGHILITGSNSNYNGKSTDVDNDNRIANTNNNAYTSTGVSISTSTKDSPIEINTNKRPVTFKT